MTVDNVRGAVAPDLVRGVISLCKLGDDIGDLKPRHSYAAEIATDAVFNAEFGLSDESQILHKKSTTMAESEGGNMLPFSLQNL